MYVAGLFFILSSKELVATPVFKSVILKCCVEICTFSKDMLQYVHFVEILLDMCQDGFKSVVLI